MTAYNVNLRKVMSTLKCTPWLTLINSLRFNA